MNTKKAQNPGDIIAADWMSKYSNCAWSDAAASSNNNLGSNATSAFLTTGELNLMSHFSSLNSSLTLHSSAESDATSSSTSSSSATNNSSNSLSVSPNTDARDTPRPTLTSAHQVSNHLLELQKEIKEEEEEIFADINSLINSRSNLYSTLSGEDYEGDDGVEFDSDENLSASFKNRIGQTNNNINHLHNDPLHNDPNHNTTITSILTSNNNNHSDHHYNHHHNHHHHHNLTVDKHPLPGDSDHLNDYQSQEADGIKKLKYPSDRVKITSTLNEQNRHEDNQFPVDSNCRSTVNYYTDQDDSDYLQEPPNQELNDDQEQVVDLENEPQHLHDKQKILTSFTDQTGLQTYPGFQASIPSNLPKPCVFFLEGNCRRSDCKYSHDLSNITCKYWHEGFCFKGELCPFLHDYNSPSDPLDSDLLDEDGLKLLAQRELIPTFAIESEADFPSLPLDAPPTSALNDSTKSSINTDITNIKDQILSSNSAVLFKTVKKKRKKG